MKMGTITWKDIEKQNEIAAGWLLNYHKRRETYFKMLNDFSELAATQYTGMPHGSSTGNPTSTKAIDLSRLKNDELWIMTIEDTERILSPKKTVFLEVRRQAEDIKHDGDVGRPNWAGYTQVNYAEKLNRLYNYHHIPGDRTMRSWWESMVNIVVRIAIKRGCL
jgi:hypothetical protein